MILYKYVVRDRIDILDNGLIRFTQASSLNDPFETRPHIDALLDRRTIKPTVDGLFASVSADEALFDVEYERALADAAIPKEIVAQVRAIIPEEEALSLAKQLSAPIFMALLGLEGDDSKQLAQERISAQLGKRFGTLSLTENPSNLLMWAHYAGCHSGFVIGLDASHDFFDQRLNERDQVRRIRKVQYSEVRPSFTGLDLGGDEDSQLAKLASDFFLTKSHHWSYEDEWRMLMEVTDADRVVELPNDTVYLFRLPTEAVSSVIFGCKMVEADKERLLDVLRRDNAYKRVAVYQAAVDPRDFRLNINPVQDAT